MLLLTVSEETPLAASDTPFTTLAPLPSTIQEEIGICTDEESGVDIKDFEM